MNRRIALWLVLASLAPTLVACGGEDSSSPAPEATTEASAQPAAEKAERAARESKPTNTSHPDPLVGAWSSGSVPMERIRAELLSVGYSDPETDDFLREFGLQKAASLKFRLVFYSEGDRPFVAQYFWDPSKGGPPEDPDHGPYELLPRHRVAITSADPEINKYRYVFAYDASGEELRLEVVSLENPGISEASLRLERPLFYAFAATPLDKE